jgi:hypothetical protein
MSRRVYDVIVIGAVPPGEMLAGREVGRGRSGCPQRLLKLGARIRAFHRLIVSM